MSRQRDSQRSKVYAAERRHSLWSYTGDMTLGEVRTIVDDAIGSGWWCELTFGDPRGIEVRDGRGRRHAGANPFLGVLLMPRWSRSPLVLAHELAHVAAFRWECEERNIRMGIEAGHGWRFCRSYLTIIEHTIGLDEAFEMRSLFTANRVRFVDPLVVKS